VRPHQKPQKKKTHTPIKKKMYMSARRDVAYHGEFRCQIRESNLDNWEDGRVWVFVLSI